MTAAATMAAPGLRAAMVAYRDVLRVHQQRINRLNVYPVPDGDTGTNMALTLEAVVHDVDGVPEDASMGAVCQAVAHGSLMGARGNSGVILSQLLRGICEELGNPDGTVAPNGKAASPGEPHPGGSAEDAVGPVDLARALVCAAELAQKAVVRPVEGTILTVARAAGQGATDAANAGSDDLVAVVEAARDAAAESLRHTPELLPVLARAGVVDAGGAGYVLFFDALLHVLDGRALPEAPPQPDGAVPAGAGAGMGSGGAGGAAPFFAELGDGAVGAGTEEGVSDLRYEVMYLLHAPDEAIEGFKEVWAGIGDSIVVVGGGGLWNCHIHTDDIGAAIEAALDAGRPQQIRVTDLNEQVQEERWVREGSGAPPAAPAAEGAAPERTTAVVAVVTGDGIGRIFRSLGVHQQVFGGQSMNPSTAQILEAVEAAEADQVVILPNNRNIQPVAEQVDALTTKAVRVVPTGSIVEGFAALLAYDPGADAATNEEAMRFSAQRVVPAEVTRAVRDADTEAGPVHAGDYIGLSRDGVVSVADTVVGATCGLLQSLLTDQHELVTIIEGEGSTHGDTRQITEWLSDEHPAVAHEVHHGGQPLYPYLLGIE